MAHPISAAVPAAAAAGPQVVAPGGPPPAPVPPPTYRELFSDEANSPQRDRLENYLSGYRFLDAVGAAVPTPATLRDQTVVLSDRQPMAFLALVPGPAGVPEVSVVHRLMRYMDMPGEPPSGYHDRVLGIMGDIMPHQYPTVEVPGTAFHLVAGPVRVPTTAAMITHLPTWEDPAIPLGPYLEEEPETEVVQPRHVQLLPGYYAALLVHRRGVLAKTAYQELHGAMVARNEVELCRDVITWLKVACTARGGGGPNNGVPAVLHPLVPVHVPPSVYTYVTNTVWADLPGVVAPDAHTVEVTTTLAGVLRALSGREGTGDERAPKEPKGVHEVYRETYRTLLRFGNVSQVEQVAPLWCRLANCAKSGEQHTILVQEFQRAFMARGLSTELYVPIVTASLKQMVLGFQFAGHGADELGTGCQPLLVSYSGSANHMQALEVATIGNQLSQGDQNASLTDYQTLRNREKLKFPKDITKVNITLGRYAVLCQTLFQGTGPTNMFVEALWKLYADLHTSAPFITDKFQREAARTPSITGIYHACIVRAVQVHMHDFLHDISVNVTEGYTGVEIPDFKSVFTDLRRGTFHVSSNWVPLPSEYMVEPTSASLSSHGASRAPSAVSTGASSVASGRTGVSSLTAEASRPGAMMRIDNPAPDAAFTSITVRPGGTRPIVQVHPPPNNVTGQVHCLSWWLRGSCYPNCGRRSTHVPFANAAERTRLLNCCGREHVAAPATAASAAGTVA